MTEFFAPALRAQMNFPTPAPAKDRVSLFHKRKTRSQPLMRKFEIASLQSCGAVRRSFHLAPSNALFEATSAALAQGTLIATPIGPIAIEDLEPGDLVITEDGQEMPVIWISSTPYTPNTVNPASTLTHLTRVTTDALCGHSALGDLLLGPAARLLQKRSSLEQVVGTDGVLTPAQDFEDGYSVLAITPPSAQRLFHLRLPHHAIISASGRSVETYHPGRDVEANMGENVTSLFLSLFPDISAFSDFGPLLYPRMSRDTLDSLVRA